MKKYFAVLAVLMALVISVPIMAMPAGQSSQAAVTDPTPTDFGMIPVRDFFELEVGATVTWDSAERSINIFIDGVTIIILTTQPLGVVNGTPVNLQDGIVLWQGTAFITEVDLLLLFMAAQGMEIEFATFYLTEEARDLALYDFDYMVNLVLENSVWDNIIYRRLGISFDQHVAHHRAYIENMVPREWPVVLWEIPLKDGDDPRSLAANYLASLLVFDFAFPLQGIGHLGMRELTMYRLQSAALYRALHDEDVDLTYSLVNQLMIDAFLHPDAIWFYGPTEVDLNEEVSTWPEIPGNIVTEIIIPGKVAYLGIRSFVACAVFDDLTTLPFLQQVRDFDHLIIDVRGNGGGDMNYFAPFIFQRLISESMEISDHEFFTSGDVATRWMRAMLSTINYMEPEDGWPEGFFVDIIPAAGFAAERGMDLINPADLARLSYVLVSAGTVHPAEDSVNFGGQIWLLVDGGSASASVGAALLAQYTGFATLVGEPTSGVMNPVFSYSVLPNTGIIWRVDIGHFTDAYGRSVEELGVVPDILNLPGMDAVETVLALIADSDEVE